MATEADGQRDSAEGPILATHSLSGVPLDDVARMGSSLVACLESPAKSDVRVPGTDALELRGWIMSSAGRPLSARASIDDVTVEETLATPIPRTDVIDFLAPGRSSELQARSFSIRLPAELIGSQSSEVVVEVSDGAVLGRSRPYRAFRTTTGRIRDGYSKNAPCPRNAIDIFAGGWSSRLPGDLNAGSGTVPTFDDGRIKRAIEVLGGVEGMRVLELGPLEAGHTAMLEQHGASEIVSVESSSLAYLKCLVVKELLGLERSHFLLGDFMAYLESTDARFDLVLASGVLYHQREPLVMLERIARVSDRLVLWTQYFAEKPGASPFASPVTARLGSRQCRLHPIDYGVETSAFCGGPELSARWMERADILGSLDDLGFVHRIIPAEFEYSLPLGPSFLVIASRSR